MSQNKKNAKKYSKTKKEASFKAGKDRNSNKEYDGGNQRVDGSRHGRMGSSVCQDKFNDPSWYANNPQLLVDSASLAFATPVGTSYRTPSVVGTQYGSTQLPALPGIISARVAPLPGNTQETNSPVNMAARQIYGFVRHANSGHANYDQTNLMMYLLAMDSLYSLFAFLMRAYGIISYYSIRNRYTGRALIETMGLDYDSLLSNLANFRAFINTFADKIGAMCVPKGMPYFIRHMWLYSNVYRDADHEKSQFYIYNPDYFYIYTETEGTGRIAGSLQPYFFNGYLDSDKSNPGLKDYIDITELVNNMIDKVMNSEDCGIMSGDILKAYGDSGIWKLSTIPAEFAVEPTFNLEVLTQFHNIFTVCPGKYSCDNVVDIPKTWGAVTEHVVGTELAPILKVDLQGNTVDDTTGLPNNTPAVKLSMPTRVFDLPYSNASPADVMVASRLHAYTNVAGMTIECGSEVVTKFELYWYVGSTLHKQFFATVFPKNGPLSGMFQTMANTKMFELLAMLEKFSFHPIIYRVDVSAAEGAEHTIANIFGDVDNYTWIGLEELKKMNQTALLSEFDTPQAAVWKLGR